MSRMTTVADKARLDELQKILAELPSFVKPTILPPATEPLTLDHFDCWSPEKTGDSAVDYEWGKRHFSTALAYSRTEDSALFVFLVIMTMRHQPIGAMERGFIDAAARCAVAGTMPPKAPDEWVSIVSRTPHDAERCRANETAMESAINLSRKQFPTLAAYVLVDLLTTDRGPIDLGVWLFAGAALNGSKY
jgi:hypothetical protein